MSSITTDERFEERIAQLEQEVRRPDRQSQASEGRLARLEGGAPASAYTTAQRTASARRPVPRAAVEGQDPPLIGMAYPHADPQRPPAARLPGWGRRQGLSLSDLVGGRVLAWIGGLATLLGIVLFLALAISRGWIGIELRVALAGAGSSALLAAGVWLHARRGRTEASVGAVGAATAGMFATLAIAALVYHLIPPLLAVAGSMLVGAFAATLAVRWAGQAIGGLGLLGALLSPVLVGAPSDAATIALLAVAGGSAMWAVIAKRWTWLGLATVIVAAPQWGAWIFSGLPVSVDLLVLTWFGVVGIAGTLGAVGRAPDERLALVPALFATLNACTLGVVGWIALHNAVRVPIDDLWLGVLAVTNLGLGLVRLRRVPDSEPLRRLLIAIGVIFADVAFGLGSSGIALVIGWSAAAVGFAWLTRRTFERAGDATLLTLAVGGQIALALLRALLSAPPSALGGQDPQLLPLLSLAVLAASCLACGHALASRRPAAVATNALGLAALAYLTAQTLGGAALVGAWSLQAAALIHVARRTGEDTARYGAAGFLALATMHTLAVEVPRTHCSPELRASAPPRSRSARSRSCCFAPAGC